MQDVDGVLGQLGWQDRLKLLQSADAGCRSTAVRVRVMLPSCDCDQLARQLDALRCCIRWLLVDVHLHGDGK
jgi:hypothetical protein